jgi:hypothetical protein
LKGSFDGTATTTASSALRARLSASDWLNAACAGSEESTAQRMRESLITVLAPAESEEATQARPSRNAGALYAARSLDACQQTAFDVCVACAAVYVAHSLQRQDRHRRRRRLQVR